MSIGDIVKKHTMNCFADLTLHFAYVAKCLGIGVGYINSHLMPDLAKAIVTKAFLQGLTRKDELIQKVVYQCEFLEKNGHWDLKSLGKD